MNTMNETMPMTRREQAEAYADLFEVPVADLYRRYGAVLLPPHRAAGRPSTQATEGDSVRAAGG